MITFSIPSTNKMTDYYINRTTNNSYNLVTDKNSLSDKYNDKSKYLHNKKYFEMPESFEPGAYTITTNNGLVLIYTQAVNQINCVIYDLFPSSFENNTFKVDEITLLNSQNTSSNFVIKNKQSYHSVVCKVYSNYLKPQCNIMTSDFHGTIDMDLPTAFNCNPQDNYCKHGLYKFTTEELDSFYIKAKPYLYISTGEPEIQTTGLSFIKCSDNLYYIANITNQSYVEFKLKGTSDCIVEFI